MTKAEHVQAIKTAVIDSACYAGWAMTYRTGKVIPYDRHWNRARDFKNDTELFIDVVVDEEAWDKAYNSGQDEGIDYYQRKLTEMVEKAERGE